MAWETWRASDETADVTAAFCALVAMLNYSIIDEYMDALECFFSSAL